MKTDIATLGGGCFWCLEAVYLELRGVQQVESGYSGGHVVEPVYEQVCDGSTGHAEVVRVHFDPAVVSYRELLEIFFTIHDPTTLNRQGNDVGTQYRSVIFYKNEAQKKAAESIIAELNKEVYNNKIVTTLEPFKAFYKAKESHQNYYQNNQQQPYCQMVIQPKLEKFEKVFKNRLKKK